MEYIQIKIEGLLVFSAPDAKQKIREAGKSKNVMIDLSDVDYMDSTGIDMIVKLYKKLKEKDGCLKLINVQSNLMHIFDMFGMHNLIEIHQKKEVKNG